MTQKERILKYITEGGKLDRLNSWFELGIIELPARVCELRGEGHEIITTMKPVMNRYGEKVTVAVYTLEVENV